MRTALGSWRGLLAVSLLLLAGCNVTFDACIAIPTLPVPVPAALGIGFVPAADDETNEIELAFSDLETIGVTQARVPLSWSRIQPTRDSLMWNGLDFLADAAQRHHIAVHLVVKDVPDWASSTPFASSTLRGSAPPAAWADWSRFILLVATRHPSLLKDWEIGENIDERQGWNGTAADYARLVVTASQIIRGAVPQSRVRLGSVTFAADRETTFLDEVLQDTANPVVPAIDALGLRADMASPSQVRERYYALRRAMVLRGLTKPVTVTGIAWSDDPALQTSCAPYQGGQTGQSEFLRETMPWLLSLGVDQVYWSYLWDGSVDDVGSSLGLIDRQLQPKAAYGALAGLIDPSRVGRLTSGSDAAASDGSASDALVVPAAAS